jgi:hypothetical protein
LPNTNINCNYARKIFKEIEQTCCTIQLTPELATDEVANEHQEAATCHILQSDKKNSNLSFAPGNKNYQPVS